MSICATSSTKQKNTHNHTKIISKMLVILPYPLLCVRKSPTEPQCFSKKKSFWKNCTLFTFYLWLQYVVKHKTHFHWCVLLPPTSRSCHFHIWDKGSLFHHFTTLLFPSGSRAPDGLWPGSVVFDCEGYPSVFLQMPSVEPLVSGHCSDLHKTKPPRHCLHSMNRTTCLIKLAQCQREDVGDSTHKGRSEVEATVISWCEKLSLLFYDTFNVLYGKKKKKTQHTSGNCYLWWKQDS